MMRGVADPDPISARLDDQIDWYERKSTFNQNSYKRIKTLEIFAAAAIPFLSAFVEKHSYMVWVIGALGALITFLEGMLQLNQYQQNWISFRGVCEALKREKYLYLANATPYAGLADPRASLAERVEILVSQEQAKWSATQLRPAKETS